MATNVYPFWLFQTLLSLGYSCQVLLMVVYFLKERNLSHNILNIETLICAIQEKTSWV